MASPTGTTTGDGKSRKRLRPLLEKVLNDNSIPQMRWTDRENKIWQMPWKHHKQTRWGDPDAFMLRELARSLYGHTETGEPEKEKLKHWKELLRNALRSLDDVNELTQLHCTDGDNPYKVYQFVAPEPKIGTRGRSRGLNDENQQVVHKATSAVGFSPESASCSTDCSYFQGNSPNDNFPLLVSCRTTSSPQQFSNVQMDNIWSKPSNSQQIRDPADTVYDKFDVDDKALSQLVLDLGLSNMANLPSSNLSFRSRSPLHIDNEAVNPINQPEVSVTDADIINGAIAPIATTCNSSGNLIMFNSSPNFACNVLSPLLMNGAAPYVSAFQKSHISNNKAGDQFLCNSNSHIYPQEGLHMEQEASTTLYMNTATAGSAIDRIRSAILTSSQIHHGDTNHCTPVDNTGLFPYNVHRQSYLSLNSFPCTSVGAALKASVGATLNVLVYYHNRYPVKQQIVKGKIRVCYVPDQETRESIVCCPDQHQFGPVDAGMFELPEVENREHNKQARNTVKILNHLKRGIIIDLRDGDIYATRYCKAVPYFCIPGQTDFQKLERNQEVKLFDCQSNIKHFLDPNCQYQNSKPDVRLVFAMKDPTKKAPALTVDIYHTEAYNMTAAAAAENTPSLEPDTSISDEYDNLFELELHLKNACKPINK